MKGMREAERTVNSIQARDFDTVSRDVPSLT
jgi:hypothetical protein